VGPGVVRFHQKGCTRFWARGQEVIVQCMCNTFTRPLMGHHGGKAAVGLRAVPVAEIEVGRGRCERG
ncbi:MAG: hypothetical protein ACRDSH_05655, partial [Pseudonocardiaceae bacterium]